MSNETETFGARLRRLREAKGWTVEQLDARTCCGSGAILAWEDDAAAPGLDCLVTLCDERALGVTLDYLATGTDPAAEMHADVTRDEFIAEVRRATADVFEDQYRLIGGKAHMIALGNVTIMWSPSEQWDVDGTPGNPTLITALGASAARKRAKADKLETDAQDLRNVAYALDIAALRVAWACREVPT